MQGKILIVDAISTNRIVLKVKLATAFYDVLQAASVEEAWQTAQAHDPDLIICAMELPDGDAAALGARLNATPATAAIPLMVIAALADPEKRLQALAAGAQEVMVKPVDDTLLQARVRSLIRAHNTAAEWQMRDDTSRALGFAEEPADFGPQGHVALIGADGAQIQKWISQLRPKLRVNLSHSAPEKALRDLSPLQVPDLFVLVLAETETQTGDVLGACQQVTELGVALALLALL